MYGPETKADNANNHTHRTHAECAHSIKNREQTKQQQQQQQNKCFLFIKILKICSYAITHTRTQPTERNLVLATVHLHVIPNKNCTYICTYTQAVSGTKIMNAIVQRSSVILAFLRMLGVEAISICTLFHFWFESQLSA